MKSFERPKTNPPLSTLDVVLEGLAAVGVFIMFAQLIRVWSSLPEEVPTHFGASGAPDDWGSKSTLLILPMVALVIYAGFTILSRFPYIFNFPVKVTETNYLTQYRLAKTLLSFVKVTVIGLFLFIQIFTIRIAFGEAAGLGVLFLLLTLAASFVPIVVYLVLASRAK
ncbi:MAG: DUF1648 domain-containing protein [Cyclobacteriaceae bacterium]|nr:DUF1648 domain-containing protein [Cyclobacteriaceae bacterium]